MDATSSLSSGLVGFWPLTDGTGATAKDITSNANDGTGSGGYSFGATTKGYAAEFDGVDGKFDLGSGTDLARNQTAMSCSAWIAADNAASNSGFIFYESNSLNVLQTRFGLRINTGAVQCVGRDDDADSFTIFAASDSSKITANDTWYHIVAVFDPTGGGCKVYRNGVDVTTTSDNTGDGFPNTASLTASIGASETTSYYDGHIQNVRIYNRALSATEVATLYNRPWEGTNYGDLWPYSPPAPADATLSTDTAATSLNADLEGWWLCTDGSGTTLVDVSGNSANGTASGTVGWDTTALGTAIEPDGSSGRVDASVSLTGYPITMAAWFKTPSASAADECIISIADSSVGTNQLRMIIENTTSKLEASGFDGTAVRAAASTTSVDDDEWHLGVAVFASSTSRKIYVDGVLEGTDTSSQTMTAFDRASLAVTADSTPAAYFGGNIQNARVWSRVLSDDEVSLLFERPFEGITYGDEFHYDPPTPANLTPLDNSSGINNSQVGWWPLTETDDYASGAADISGNGNDGTQSGGVLSDVSRLGGVASFDGVDDYISADAAVVSSFPFTFSLWVNSSNTDDTYKSILTFGKSTNSNYYAVVGFLPYTTVGPVARCVWRTGPTVNNELTPTVTVQDGEWHHLAAVFNSSGLLELYVDGVLDVSGSLTPTSPQGFDTVRIGALKRTGAEENLYPGNIQDVRIWSRALSAEEVWSIYENPWLGSAYSDTAAAAFRYLINGFKNPLIGGGLVR